MTPILYFFIFFFRTALHVNAQLTEVFNVDIFRPIYAQNVP